MVMPELSHSFTSTYPESRIVQTVADHEQLLERLLSAELDVAIIGYGLAKSDARNPDAMRFERLKAADGGEFPIREDGRQAILRRQRDNLRFGASINGVRFDHDRIDVPPNTTGS